MEAFSRTLSNAFGMSYGEGDFSVEKARHLCSLGKNQEAIAMFLQVLAVDGPNATIAAEISDAYESEGHLAKASEWAERAVEMAGWQEPALFQLARVRMLQGRFLEARVYLQEALELDPLQTRSLVLKTQIHVFLQEYSEAMETADRGLEQDPENPDFLVLRSTARIVLGQTTSEQIDLGCLEILSIGPEHATAYNHRGWSQLIKNPKAAQEDFRHALSLDSQLAAARRGLLATLRGGTRIEVIALLAWKTPLTILIRNLIIAGFLGFYLVGPKGGPEFVLWMNIPWIIQAIHTWLITCRPRGNFFLLMTRHRSLLFPSEILVAKLWAILVLVTLGLWAVLPWQASAMLTTWSFVALIPLSTIDMDWERTHRLAGRITAGFLGASWFGVALLLASFKTAAWVCWFGACAYLIWGIRTLVPDLQKARIRPYFGKSGHFQS